MSFFYGPGKFPLQYVGSPLSSTPVTPTNPTAQLVLRAGSGNITLTTSDLYCNEYFYSSTTPIYVNLPDLTTAGSTGAWVLIKNAQGAGSITVQNYAGSVVLATLTPTQSAFFVYDNAASALNYWVVF